MRFNYPVTVLFCIFIILNFKLTVYEIVPCYDTFCEQIYFQYTFCDWMLVNT
jgi:hypothetical protein